MSNTAHAGLMNGVYRRQRHIYDFTRKYYLLGRDKLIDGLQPPQGGTVIEIGCGTGRNLIAAARRYPNVDFFGIDISEEMLTTAQAKIERANLSDRISLACGDATSFSSDSLFGQPGFDRVFISYSLSMIPDWQACIHNAFRSLNQDGTLHVVDFGGQEQLPLWFKSLLFAWLAKFHVRPRLELEDVLLNDATENGRHTTIRSAYRGYAILGVVSAIAE